MTPGGGLRALISRRPPGYQMGLLYRLATRQLSWVYGWGIFRTQDQLEVHNRFRHDPIRCKFCDKHYSGRKNPYKHISGGHKELKPSFFVPNMWRVFLHSFFPKKARDHFPWKQPVQVWPLLRVFHKEGLSRESCQDSHKSIDPLFSLWKGIERTTLFSSSHSY